MIFKIILVVAPSAHLAWAAAHAAVRVARGIGAQWRRRKQYASGHVLKLARGVEDNASQDHWEAEALDAEDGETHRETQQELAAAAFAQRRIAGPTRFYRHWMAAVRLEFPLRKNRPADRAAMSKWLAGQMREKGIRITHIADAVPRIVAMALNRSRAEVEADEMAEVSAPWDNAELDY